MLGLIYKDIRTNLKWLLTAFGVVLFYNVIMFLSNYKTHDMDFIGMRGLYLLLYCSVFFTVGAFALNFIQTDERKKWGYYVTSLPNGIAKQVIAKYIFVAGTLMATFAMCYIQNFIVCQVNDEAVSISGVLMILLSIMLIILSFELPCAIAFGTKNGAYVKTGIFVGLVLFAAIYLMFGDISFLGSEEEFTEKFFDTLGKLSKTANGLKAVAVSIPVYCLSCFISAKLYISGIERMEK